MAKWAHSHFPQTYALLTGTVEKHRLPGRKIEAHVRRADPLSPRHRSRKWGGRAELFVLPNSCAQLVVPIPLERSKGVVGRG